MKNITKEELKEILELHALWLENNTTGKQADLSHTNLSNTDLSYVNLSYANLEGSDLRGVCLYDSDLTCADLTGANLSGVDLSYADLSCPNLSHTNLSGANLRGTYLYGVQNINTVITDEETKFLNNQCPKEGEFVGWKKCVIKVYDNIGCWTGCEECIVKLLIPSDAKRSSATTKKCRCSKAKVLAIYDMNGKEVEDKDFEVFSRHDENFKYKIGQTVMPDKFDENWWEECSNGIHFFMDRKLAENY